MKNRLVHRSSNLTKTSEDFNRYRGGNPVAMGHAETPEAIKKRGGSEDTAVQKLKGSYIWSNSAATAGLEQLNCLGA